jgi:hypothetical protein
MRRYFSPLSGSYRIYPSFFKLTHYLRDPWLSTGVRWCYLVSWGSAWEKPRLNQHVSPPGPTVIRNPEECHASGTPWIQSGVQTCGMNT